jgi:hypothetical protein
MNYVTIYRVNHLILLPRITTLLCTASGKVSDTTCVASRGRMICDTGYLYLAFLARSHSQLHFLKWDSNCSLPQKLFSRRIRTQRPQNWVPFRRNARVIAWLKVQVWTVASDSSLPILRSGRRRGSALCLVSYERFVGITIYSHSVPIDLLNKFCGSEKSSSILKGEIKCNIPQERNDMNNLRHVSCVTFEATYFFPESFSYVMDSSFF